MQERRTHARVPVELEARLSELQAEQSVVVDRSVNLIELEARLSALQASVRIVNLSPGGCTIMCAPHSRAVDEKVRLTFQLPNGSKKFCLNGRVKWCETELVGIEFSDCTLPQEIDLIAFVVKVSAWVGESVPAAGFNG